MCRAPLPTFIQPVDDDSGQPLATAQIAIPVKLCRREVLAIIAVLE
jgi:hypothetical protein